MKNRASSPLLIILIILGFEIAGYAAIHRAALLRGYETSIIGAVRDLLLFLPLIILLFKGLRTSTGSFITGGWITGIIIMAIAVIAAVFTHESFGKEMNFLEI